MFKSRVFNAQTGWKRPTVYRRIVSFLPKMCIIKKKIKNKKLATHIFIEDFLWKTDQTI